MTRPRGGSGGFDLAGARRPLGPAGADAPRPEPSAKGGRPRVDDRVCFNAIIFVLFTGIAWLGRQRWVVERSFAWLHNFRRLRTRYERLPELHLAFMQLGCAVICQRALRSD
jgi:transposase